MIAYLDSSVLLRVVLGQADALSQWDDIDHGVTSALAEVECLRTLDRLRVTSRIAAGRLATFRAAVFRLLGEMEMVELTGAVLRRAAQPLTTALGTLDAIHLATALLWRERAEPGLVLATHDQALGSAARCCGLSVVGV